MKRERGRGRGRGDERASQTTGGIMGVGGQGGDREVEKVTW